MYSYDRANMQGHHQVGGGMRSVASGETMMMLLELPPRASVPLHSHPHEQVGIVIEGEIELTIGTERKRMKAGDMYIILGGIPHQAVGSDTKARFLPGPRPPHRAHPSATAPPLTGPCG